MKESNIYKKVERLEQRVLELEKQDNLATIGNFATFFNNAH